MSLLPLLALGVGFLIFWVPSQNMQANELMARYTAIAILAGLDTILGGLRASMEDKFDNVVFISGFFVNVLLAAGLLWLGEYFALQTGLSDNRIFAAEGGNTSRISVMMIAVVVIFSTRILNNLASLRRLIIDRLRAKSGYQAQTSGEISGTSAPNLVK